MASGLAEEVGAASTRESPTKTRAQTFGKAEEMAPALTRGATARGPVLSVMAGAAAAGGGGEALGLRAGDSPSRKKRSRALA